MRTTLILAFCLQLAAYAQQEGSEGAAAYLRSYIETVTPLVDRLERAPLDSLRHYATKIKKSSRQASDRFARLCSRDNQSVQLVPLIASAHGKPALSYMIALPQAASPAPVVKNIDHIIDCANAICFGRSFRKTRSRNIEEMRESLVVLRWLL